MAIKYLLTFLYTQFISCLILKSVIKVARSGWLHWNVNADITRITAERGLQTYAMDCICII